ncbi:MAG: glycosyltransferase family 4 protein [Candidatus Omnitrophica bacterium]|nr:glycosyltransferase family 4 protein [Candidatus Omnitrophota bacterium]
MEGLIGVDARMIRHTGIGTYLRGILGEWKDLPRHEMPLLFGNPELCRQAAVGYECSRFNPPIYSIQEQLFYTPALKRCQLWHAPHYNIPLRVPAETRLVVTIHDLIHWIFRKEFFSPLQAGYASFMLTRAVQSASHVITVSENTKQDLVRYFGADPRQVTVTYEAVSPMFRPLQDSQAVSAAKQRLGVSGKYFLYVGSLKPHKNVLSLLRAFRKLRAEHKLEAGLVLAGRKDKKYPRGYEELAELQDGEGVFHRTGISDEDLVALYNGALALVHPSLYEGFGLTLLEAMACGTPVAALRVASIPEVTGEAAYLLDPEDPKAFMHALLRLEQDTGYREALAQKGLQRAKQFSWKKTAEQTWAVYQKVIKSDA